MVYNIILGRTESDKKKFGERGTIYLGRSYVKMGATTSLSNKVLMDVARSHVVLVAGKRGCLTGDTLVFTDKGNKFIKDFNENEDKILSFDKETKKFEWENAEFLEYSIEDEELLKIKFENGRKIELTREHPLLAVTGDRLLSLLWLKAYQFNIGDNVLSKDLEPLKIKKISKIKGIKKVYDLRVPKNHSFIANGIISHNSGKSYSLSVMAEEMSRLPHDIKKNLSMLFFDTMGIFWTMKYPNERQEDLLKKWNLEPEGFDIDVYVPQGSFEEYKEKGLPVDHSFSIKTSELNSSDWCGVFEINIIEPIGILIDRIVSDLKEEGDYDIIDIIRRIKVDKRSKQDVKDACENRFLAAQKWGLFSRMGTRVSELLQPGKITILDISAYKEGRNIKGLVVGLLSKKILSERIVSRKAEELEAIEEGSKYFGEEEVQEKPLIWLFIDEGHIFLPKEGDNPAKIPLIHLLREGRQPGISMVIATQQPGEIARDVMTQSDIVFSHRVTAKADIEALNAIMQTYLLSDVKAYLNNLPRLKGSAIILDDNSERIYPMRVRPKISWHGGETPTSIKTKKREELSLL